MWWAGTDTADVYVGTRAFAAGRNGETPQAQAVASLHEALQALIEWLNKSPRKMRIKVWLSGGLCRPFLMPELAGIQSHDEVERTAPALAARATGFASECKVWLDKAGNSESTVAVAVEAITIEQVLATVGKANKRHIVAAIRPWWTDSLRAALLREPNLAALAAQDCDSLTLLTGTGRGFSSASTMTPVLDRATADAALARHCLSEGLDEQQVLLARLEPHGTPHESTGTPMAFGMLTELSR